MVNDPLFEYFYEKKKNIYLVILLTNFIFVPLDTFTLGVLTETDNNLLNFYHFLIHKINWWHK